MVCKNYVCITVAWLYTHRMKRLMNKSVCIIKLELLTTGTMQCCVVCYNTVIKITVSIQQKHSIIITVSDITRF